MMNELFIGLEAKDPEANRLRSWQVEAGPDLFGVWTAKVCFSRIGTVGRAVRHDFASVSEAEVRSFVRAKLRRRRTAQRRIGVAYRTIAASPIARPLLQLTGFADP
jgi:hypothetical protein